VDPVGLNGARSAVGGRLAPPFTGGWRSGFPIQRLNGWAIRQSATQQKSLSNGKPNSMNNSYGWLTDTKVCSTDRELTVWRREVWHTVTKKFGIEQYDVKRKEEMYRMEGKQLQTV
jgi:hypothetical protein